MNNMLAGNAGLDSATLYNITPPRQGDKVLGGVSIFLPMPSIHLIPHNSTLLYRLLCRAFQINSIVSLLQPPPEVYALFDDLILMAQG